MNALNSLRRVFVFISTNPHLNEVDFRISIEFTHRVIFNSFHFSGTILFSRRDIPIRISYWRNWWSTIPTTKFTSSWILIHYVCARTLDNCDFGIICGQSVSAALLIDCLRKNRNANGKSNDKNITSKAQLFTINGLFIQYRRATSFLPLGRPFVMKIMELEDYQEIYVRSLQLQNPLNWGKGGVWRSIPSNPPWVGPSFYTPYIFVTEFLL